MLAFRLRLPPVPPAGDMIEMLVFLFSAERFLLSISLSTISLLCICIEFYELTPQPDMLLFPLLDANEVLPLLRVELVCSLIDG
jgi:hypothetical protein